MEPCSLYLISPPRIVLADFMPLLQQALGASPCVRSFQLRLKDAAPGEVEAAAKKLMPLCHEHEVAFILNDDVALAKKLDADGVHLGQEDMNIAEARGLLGADRVIGVSCHASRHMAMEAGEGGADYVAFGAFYPTTSKPMEKVEKWGMPEPEILGWWTEVSELPCVAIGGITPENCMPLVLEGADFIAAITSVWQHAGGPAAAVKAFEAVFESAGR